MSPKSPKPMKKTNSSSLDKIWTIYRWCLSFLLPYKWTFVWLMITGMVFTLAELMVPKFIQYFIDVIIPSQDTRLLFALLGVVALILAAMYAARFVHNILQRVLQEKAARDVQYALFAQLRNLGFAYFERHPIGESLSLMNTEVTALQQLYRDKFPASIRYFLFSAVSVLIMLSISWQLTLVMVPCLILYQAVGPGIERKATRESKIMSEKRVQYSQKIYESVTALTELRAHAGAERWDQARWLERLNQWNASLLRMHWFASWRGTIRRLSYYTGGIAIFLLGPYFIQKDLLSVGAFVAFILYYFEVMQRITVFFTLITDQKLIAMQAGKLYHFIRLDPDIREAEKPVVLKNMEGRLSFQHVSFTYMGENSAAVLDDFQLDIHAGERVALVGASGNGKSTIVKLLARFYDPQQGQVLIDGVPVQHISLSQLRQSIGIVFQETYLFGTSVLDNIRFGNPEATDEQIVEAAKAANAHSFIERLSEGYDTLLGERGVKLSGGEKQRIAIARMMVKNPQIILLDEATSSLDNVNEQEVQEALDRLFKGKTTIAVAHRLSTVKDFDKIVLLEGGKAAEIGTYKELMASRGLFYRLCMGGDFIREEVR